MAETIKYEDKSPYQTQLDIPENNKTTAKNINEIKRVVNNNAEELDIANGEMKKLNKKMDVVVASPLNYKGAVSNYSDLAYIEILQNGDIYSVTSENKNYVYSKSSEEWIEYNPIINVEIVNEQLQNLIKELPITISNAILEDNKQKYPVGKIIISTEDVNPKTYLGFGTWEKWGQGRVPVGVNSEDKDFNTAEKTGGEKEHTLTVQEMPSHYHNLAIDGGNDAGTMDRIALNGYGSARWYSNTRDTGNGKAHNNMPPYITCFMFKRIA
ncbi:MAG: phage baseplate protein [Clostridia bacterium]